MGITVSADKSAWNAVGDAASDEAARGEGKRWAADADESTGRPRGGVSSVDEASQTTMWRMRPGKKTERGLVLQTQPQEARCGHRLCGKVRADGCGGCRCRRGRREEAETAVDDVTGLPYVASVDKASYAEGRGAETCRWDSQGQLWVIRCGRGEPGLPP